jgi:hypothetical protein
MKKYTIILFALFSLLLAIAPAMQAQQLRTIFGNTGFGAANGAALGAATMALRNSSNANPVTFGIGAGILAGAGMGVYDLAYNSGNENVNGLFNSVPLSGAIVFLDTMYGTGAGALVGIAFSLMGAGDFTDGLRVGAGVGAWAGFAFGLADAFYFSQQRQDNFFDYGYQPGVSPYTSASGFLSLHDSKNSSIALLNPIVLENNHPGHETRGFALEIMRMHIRL